MSNETNNVVFESLVAQPTCNNTLNLTPDVGMAAQDPTLTGPTPEPQPLTMLDYFAEAAACVEKRFAALTVKLAELDERTCRNIDGIDSNLDDRIDDRVESKLDDYKPEVDADDVDGFESAVERVIDNYSFEAENIEGFDGRVQTCIEEAEIKAEQVRGLDATVAKLLESAPTSHVKAENVIDLLPMIENILTRPDGWVAQTIQAMVKEQVKAELLRVVNTAVGGLLEKLLNA